MGPGERVSNQRKQRAPRVPRGGGNCADDDGGDGRKSATVHSGPLQGMGQLTAFAADAIEYFAGSTQVVAGALFAGPCSR